MNVGANAPLALMMIKQPVRRGIDTPLMHGVALESDLNYLLNFSEDMKEGGSPPSPRNGSRDLPGGRLNRGPVIRPVDGATQPPIFPPRSRVWCRRRKTMALKLRADCGQTRGQYPAPPPLQLELKGLITVRSILPQGRIPGLQGRGRNRIDGREEALNCARHDTAVIGSKT
jgi:hypothetical protein